MSIVMLLVVVLLIGVAAHYISTAPIVKPEMKWIANAILVVLAIVIVLEFFGVMPAGSAGCSSLRRHG